MIFLKALTSGLLFDLQFGMITISDIFWIRRRMEFDINPPTALRTADPSRKKTPQIAGVAAGGFKKD
ncbi:MAG: hypothetical protein GXO78_06540 [Calditrichaeota bacterium]|nr:hypothetical protein [Calditrichota bacterium]